MRTELGFFVRELFTNGHIIFQLTRTRAGRLTPVYTNLRSPLPPILRHGARLLWQEIQNSAIAFDRLAPVPTAATPYVSVISDRFEIPMIMPRTLPKDYGTRAMIDGDYRVGDQVALCDDVCSKADSKIRVIEILVAEKLVAEDVFVLIDRQEGGREVLEAMGVQLHAVMTLSEVVHELYRHQQIELAQLNEVSQYLGDPDGYTQMKEQEYADQQR